MFTSTGRGKSIMSISTRVWLITGASTGFGRALAEAVLERGEFVAGTFRHAEQMRDFEQIDPARALAVHMDVRHEDQVRAGVQATIERFGRIDVLVNNAAHGFIGAIEETTDAEARALFDTNLFGALHVLRAVIPHMRQRRSGHILNISSQGGIVSFQGSSLYCATKHALEAISEGMAKEIAHLGIKVTIVEPGVFRTDFAGRSMVLAKQVIEDYAPTVGQRRRGLKTLDGAQRGDPARGAKAIIEAVNSPVPPLRLALGPDALKIMREKITGVLQDFENWEAISSGTDFPV
jgi:NAD(P)-dependent dehydrogenase (short-subunit alcohol dehydrogenase family)